MPMLEVLAGCGLLLGALVAAQRHRAKCRRAGLRLVGIAALATAGALLMTMPVREQLQEQRAAAQVGR